MIYREFRNKTDNLPIIDTRLLKLEGYYTQSLRTQLQRWTKKGLIFRLRNNLYLLQDKDRKKQSSRQYISAELYKPSYVSMEYALSHYGLIPEGVADITSITTRKTRTFTNTLGHFVYQHAKRETFTGFTEQKDESGLPWFIALPEKAVVDFIYLNLARFQKDFNQTLTMGFRFQNLECLNVKKLLAFSKLYNNSKLVRVVHAVISLVKE